MSPHGDLIAFGVYVLVIAIPSVWYYLWTLHRNRLEWERHNASIERHNYRMYQAIKQLGGCAYGKGR